MASDIMNEAALAFDETGPSEVVATEISRNIKGISRNIDACCKRIIDVVIALSAILLLSPLIICLVITLRATGPSVLFAHRRVGRRGSPFPCYKFRSMVPNSDEILARYLASNPDAAHEWQTKRKLKRDPRVTGLGRIMRESSVDELPQLINVLLGHMSFVGPRPVMFEELHFYGATARDYFAVRPGLTGLWQVSGRNALNFIDRVEFDRHYVRNRSLFFDLSIMARTVPEVVWRRRTS